MRVRLSNLTLLLALAPVLPAHAGGPLLIFDASTRTPWAYSGTVDVYTDRGTMGPTLTNAEADALTSFGFDEWTAVSSATFAASIAGDFGSIGLPNITGGNAGLVVGSFNGGGIHVMYDDDGSIISSFFGAPPGVLGIASPEYGGAGTLTESWAVMNGTSVDPADGSGTFFAGVFTHEFGHAINLAHSQTNGAIFFFGDDSGPEGCANPYGGSPTGAQIETMYPFLNVSFGGPGAEMSTINTLDDIASLSNVYPTASWPGSFGTITGTVLASDGTTEITGINVIARNLSDPFGNAISALSGDFTQGDLGPDGLYTFNGLTGGADYVVYIDGIVAGGFSTTPSGVPGPAEEFHNGGFEDSDPLVDDRCASTAIAAVVGSSIDANVIVNEPYISLNDDSFQEVALPFAFPFCDASYSSVFIGANGFLTFGSGDTDFSQSVSEFLSGAPRIAALWTDLSPQLGTVTADEVGAEFVITFSLVPEFNTNDLNTFSFHLRPDGSYRIDYGAIGTSNALVGRTPGGGAANPGETNLGSAAQPIGGTTVYESFTAFDFDLDNLELAFDTCGDPCVANTPPVASCQNVIVMGDSAMCAVSVAASHVDNGSSDADGDSLTLSLEPAGPYAEGVTNVSLIVTDTCGAADTCAATITVTCPQGPQLLVDPKDLILAPVALGDTTCGIVTISNTGDDTLDVLSVTGCDSGSFYVDLNGTATSVAPGDSTTLQVCFVTNSLDPAMCELTIDTNDSLCVVSVSVDPCSANSPPVASCQNVMVMGDSTMCEVDVTAAQVDNGSTDPDGDSLTLTLEPPGPYAEGVTNVNLIVSDSCGAADTCAATITVDCLQGPNLEVEPKQLMLTAVAFGDTTCDVVTIINSGDDTLDVFSVTGCDTADFYLDLSGLSTAVAPGDSTTLQVCYITNGPDGAMCELAIDTNDTLCVVSVSVGTPTDVPDPADEVTSFFVGGASPNPFRGATEIRFGLPREAPVRIVVYDLAGRRVRTLLRDGACPPGQHRIAWDGRDVRGSAVASGVYFVKVTTGTQSRVIRAVLTR